MDIQTYGHYMLKFHIDSHIAFLAFQSVDVLSFRLAIIESALEASIRRLSRINVICVGSNPREAMFLSQYPTLAHISFYEYHEYCVFSLKLLLL